MASNESSRAAGTARAPANAPANAPAPATEEAQRAREMFEDRRTYYRLLNAGLSNENQRDLIKKAFGNVNTNKTVPDVYAQLANRPNNTQRLIQLKQNLNKIRNEAKKVWLNKRLAHFENPNTGGKKHGYTTALQNETKQYNDLLKLRNAISNIPKSRAHWTNKDDEDIKKYLELTNNKASLSKLLGRTARTTPSRNVEQTIGEQKPARLWEQSNWARAMHLYHLNKIPKEQWTNKDWEFHTKHRDVYLPTNMKRYIELMSKLYPSNKELEEIMAYRNPNNPFHKFAKPFHIPSNNNKKTWLKKLANTTPGNDKERNALANSLHQYGMHPRTMYEYYKRRPQHLIHSVSVVTPGTPGEEVVIPNSNTRSRGNHRSRGNQASRPRNNTTNGGQNSTFATAGTAGSGKSRGGFRSSATPYYSSSSHSLDTPEVVLNLLGVKRNANGKAESILIEADAAHACIKKNTLFVTQPRGAIKEVKLKNMGPNTWKYSNGKIEFFVRRMRFSSEEQLVNMVELANTRNIPFFAKVLGAARCQRKYYVVFTEAFDMTLKQWFNHERDEVQPSEFVSALLQIMVALAAVHSQNLVHGAISSSTIVVKPSLQRRITSWKMLVGNTLLSIKKTTATFALNNLVRAKAFASKQSVRPPPCEVRDVLRLFASGRGVNSDLYMGMRVLYKLARRGNMDAPTFLQDPEVLHVLTSMSSLAFKHEDASQEDKNAAYGNQNRYERSNNNTNTNENDQRIGAVLDEKYQPYEGVADCTKRGSRLPTPRTLRLMVRDAKHRLNIASHARSLFGI